ncbi:MAG: methylenetetrahydrofolate reductase, partial [Clostridia bacterium]|nr:methylenetetrahydrofolate reductase [Clostridia bacterium]
LTCVSSTRDTVREKIAAMKAAGIENVMALRGDIPEARLAEDRSAWDYRHAIDLIRELKESGADFCIGGACYPEIHPESTNQKEDIRYLKEKVDAGCEFLTTQMFFDNHLLYNFLYKIREAGITVPVVAGIMPITNAKQVERAIKLSGSFMPQRFKALVDKFGSDDAAMKQAGIAYATDQIIDLFANNVTNVHVYSMNKPDVAEQIQKNLSAMIGK